MKQKFTVCTLNVTNGKAEFIQKEFLANYLTSQTAYEKRHDKPGQPRYNSEEFVRAFQAVNAHWNLNQKRTVNVSDFDKFLGKPFALVTDDACVTAHIVFIGEPDMERDEIMSRLFRECDRVVLNESERIENEFQAIVQAKKTVSSLTSDVLNLWKDRDTHASTLISIDFKPLKEGTE